MCVCVVWWRVVACGGVCCGVVACARVHVVCVCVCVRTAVCTHVCVPVCVRVHLIVMILWCVARNLLIESARESLKMYTLCLHRCALAYSCNPYG